MIRLEVSRLMLLHVFAGTWLFAPTLISATAIELSSLTIKSDAPVSGDTSLGTVNAASPAPAGGVTVILSSSNKSVASVSASVFIPAGTKNASFTIKTGVVTNATSVTITAKSANTRSARITVNPARTVNWTGGPGPAIPITRPCFAAGFNADGKADLACYTGSDGSWNVVLSTGSGWKSQFWNGQAGGFGGPDPAIPVTNQCFAADFNGDGKKDLACYTGESGSWNVALSTGSNWRSEFWNGGPGPAIPVRRQCFAGDFNGDGKADLACYTGSDGRWNVALSTGSGWRSEFWSGDSGGNGGPAPALPVSNQCFAADFNGDRKIDLACYTGESGSWNVALSTGSNWRPEFWSSGPAPAIPVGRQCFAADFNGDGKADLACYTGSAGIWNVVLSTGSGWKSEYWAGQSGGNRGPAPALPITNQCFTGDFNRDRKGDLACWTGNGGSWNVALSTGSNWQSLFWNNGPVPIREWFVVPVQGQCFATDFNGDGKADLACYTGSAGVWSVALSSGHGW
jgi:FG-GAP-like repeat